MEWLMLPVLCPLLMGILAIVAAATSTSQQEKARRLEMAHRHQWAQHNGLHCTPNDHSIAMLSVRAPFGIGSDRIGHDVFRGSHRGARDGLRGIPLHHQE
ncbi:hypothetical protein [Nocardia crassostreae]|uniref:hypothetical protein n=1 Tax=Nocardia crassostreae TaxID=53428 RepID=UPI00082EAA91|nr:hypothetical protein [Nocardia crassostreae]